MDHDNQIDQCIHEFYYNTEFMIGDCNKKFAMINYHIEKTGGGQKCC